MNQCGLENIDAIVLCGGLGTRLQGVVTDLPKSLAPINGRASLDILLDRLFANGIGRAILCVGYRKEQVIEHIQKEVPRHPSWGKIVFSEEDVPLGTGGAVKNAEAKIASDQFFVINGDTFSEVPFLELYDFHHTRGSMVTIAAASVPGRSDVGSIDIRADRRIIGFRERSAERTGFVNAGTCLMQKAALRYIPRGSFSLERDFFPKIVAGHPCFAFLVPGDVLDIGTPERYSLANQLFTWVESILTAPIRKSERRVQKPLVSIVCGVLNVAEFIEQTIQSVIAQSYTNWELIIMDGDSRDGTVDIVKKYAERYKNIRLYSRPDKCQWEAVDRGLLMTKGDFVGIIAGQDGFLDKDWFAKAVEVFKRDTDVSLVWGVNRGMSEAGELYADIHSSYSHLIRREGTVNALTNVLVKLIRVIGDMLFGSWRRRKILLGKIFSRAAPLKMRIMIGRTFPGDKIPQKQEWFSYWLRTGLMFPDESMLVSRRVLLECMPRYQIGHIVVNHLPEFYFNFNARGYLAYFVPKEVSYGRMHKFNSGERVPEVLAGESEGYFKKVAEFSRKVRSFHCEIIFIDRNGIEVSRKKF